MVMRMQLAALLVIAAASPAFAEVVGVESIEWRVADADAIVRAVVTKVDTKPGAINSHSFVETATLTVTETLKGKAPATVSHAVTLYSLRGWEVFDRPSRWKNGNVELLVFLKGDRITSVLRLDGKKSHGQGHRAFTMNLKTCTSKNSILAAVYEALAFEEHAKPGKKSSIDLPMGKIFYEVSGGSSVFMFVPLDHRLEQAVARWLKSNDPFLKSDAERILKSLKAVKAGR